MVRFIGGGFDHLIVRTTLISVQHVSHSPAPAEEANGSTNADLLQELVNIRDAKIAELEHEAAILRDQIQLQDSQACDQHMFA